MKRVTITIETVNAAFDGRPELELADILARLAGTIADGYERPTIARDSNGNKVAYIIWE